MTGDKRIQNSPWQGRIAVLLLILAFIAVPAVALGGTDLTLNTTEPIAGVPDEIPPSIGAEENGTPEPTPTETVAEEVTPEATEPLPESLGISASESAPLPAPRHIFFEVANNAGVKYDLDGTAYGGPNGTYYIKADGGGLNELRITNDVDTPLGQVTVSNDQSGVFWLTNNGGRGFYDNVILLVSVNGTIPDDFALQIKASGYTWTPPSNATALPTDYTYVEGAVDETFTKEDFIYGPQTWKPGPGDLVVPSLPLYYGQDINDQSTESYLMFVDLNVGHMYPGSFTDATLTDNGGTKVEFTFTNLTGIAAFNGYGWCLAAPSGQGISWTNRVSGTNSTGYLVNGVPSAPVANFTANITAGDAPLAVQFTDTSTGSPTTWAWDFEDNGIIDSTDKNPTHTYTTPGTYTVNLTVTNDGGSDSMVKTDYISVSEAPVIAPIANFTASATNGTVPFFVRFNDTSTNSPTAWEWDFGDEATSTAQNATHTYMAAGTYSVNLTVTNEAGTDSKIKQDYITVGETPSGKGLADTAWPKFGYDLQNTGQSPYLGPQTATIKWTYTISIEDPAGQPAIGSDGTIYIECIDRHLYALNPDGTPKWNFTAENRLYGSPAIGKDGTIYIGSTDKNLYAINPDGTLKWTYTTDSSISESSATIAPDGTIYIGTTGYQKNTLHAISDDGTQGTTKWTFNAGQLYSTPAVGTDGTIYIGSLDKNLYALNPDGTLKWTYTTGGKMQRTSPSIGTDGTIYIGNADNNLYAINPDGTLKWTYTFGSYIYSSVAIGSDGTIYTGNNDKKVYAINPDGTLKWDFTTENMIRSTPVLGSDGTIYIGSYDRKFYALNPDGTLNWMYTTGGGINCHAAIGSDGTLYIGTTENIIYAFKDPVTPPTADFTANVTSGDAPLTVAFTDTSTGSPTTWAWGFGDTTTSTDKNPTYTYTTPGTYTVNLTVSNEAGSNSMVKTGYITVTELYVPQPARIVVTPSTAELAVGATQAFAATVYDTDEMAMNDAAVTWASSNETVGMVNTAGLFTARAPGTTTVTAAYANVAGTAVATVTLPKGDQTQDTPLDIPGCNVTPGDDGKSQVSINTTTTNATVSGTTIRIEEDNFTLTIETEGAPTNESGTVNGTIANIRLDTNPVVTELGSVGTVSASVSANLTGIPQGAGLTTTVSQNVSADAQSAFQLAATADGLNLGDVAYTLNIVRTNLENGQDIAGATIRMAVSPAWVTAHGGVDAIRIIRSAEDGTKEVLATTLVGTDADGNIVFEAVSPNGLSIFGLAAATAASQPTQASSSSGGSSGTATAVGAASNLKPGESTTLSMDATAISAVTLTTNTGIKDVMVTVAKGSLPRDAEPPAGTVYQYVQATLYKAAEVDFSSVQLRLAVPTTWLAENGCTADQVTLFRYADGAWQAVPVEALGEENGNAVFSAAANGFGLFAIAATEPAPGTAGDVTPQPTATGSPVQAEAAAQTAGSTPTPQASPLPVWVAILAFGFLLFVRRT